MRKTMIHSLVELAKQDPRIVFLTGDLGYMVIEEFFKEIPERFFNVGIAEQNMIGVATGLAEAGYIPFVYSIAPFAVLRPYEFIRNGPIAHRLPVRIIGVGGGVDYSTNGLTHYGLEDLGVMRIQPGITVIAPGDSEQTRSALLATWDLPGPIYFRIGKDESQVNGLDGRFQLGKEEIVKTGADYLVFSLGSITNEVLSAINALENKHISGMLALISSLNPVNTSGLVELLSGFRHVFTVEDHYINGALGSLIAEVIAENGLACKLVRCGFRVSPDGKTGSKDFLYNYNGISSVNLAETILNELGLS
jgi:transketolase